MARSVLSSCWYQMTERICDVMPSEMLNLELLHREMWWRWLSAVGVFFSEMKCACSAKTTTKSTTSHLHTSSLRFIAASYQVLFTFFYLHLWHLRFESKEVWKDLVLFRAATKYSFYYWFLYVYIFFICFVWSTTRLVYKMSEYSEKCKSWQSDVF